MSDEAVLSLDARGNPSDDAQLQQLATQLGQALLQRQWQLTLAESCTGGWIAKCVTDVAGSSAWFEHGIVSYSNAAKQKLLGVDAGLLERHGAVSREVCQAMVAGALAASGADLAAAVSGIAGPGGAVPGKPVGTVWLAWGSREGASGQLRLQIRGDREQVRRATVAQALRILIQVLAQ